MAEKKQLSNVEIISNDTFERLKSRNSRRRILRMVSYVLTALFFCTVFGVICVTVFFKVASVEITGTVVYGYENTEILKSTGIEYEQSLYAVNSKTIKQSIINKFPYVKDVKVKRYLPDTIVIELIEDIPYYYLVIGGEYFVLSQDLRVLEMTENVDRIQRISVSYKLIKLELPSVIYAVVGENIIFKRETNFSYTKKMLDLISASDVVYNITRMNFVNKYNIYFIYGNYKVMLGNNENITAKLMLAKEIINRIGEDPAVIYVTDITKGSVRQDAQVVIE